MKRFYLLFILLAIGLGLKAQFSFFDTTSVAPSPGLIISNWTSEQKTGVLDCYARGLPCIVVKRIYGVPTDECQVGYDLCGLVNNYADSLVIAYPGNNSYSALLDNLEDRYETDDIKRNWLDAIMTKKINYCTRPEYLEGMNDEEKWNYYLYLCRNAD